MSYLPQQYALSSSRPSSNAFNQPFRTDQGFQATLQDRKRYIQANSAFAGNSTIVIGSGNRIAGTIGNATYRLPKAIIAYAVSLKSLTLPVSWPNVLNTVHFDVTYSPGGQPYPGDFTMPAGNYTYNLYQGQVTYTQVNAESIYVNQNDIVWYLLRWFGGAITSITIDPSTGGWIWVWNAAMTSVVSSSTDVTDFFKVVRQSGTNWQSDNPIDLAGPKNLLISCPEMYSEAYFSVAATNQSYICSVPVNQTYGDVIAHTPAIETVNWFGGNKPISQFTISITDAATDQLVPLYIDYVLELTFWLENPINQ